ncbi:hypothetical protein, partial [Desulfurella sp.]
MLSLSSKYSIRLYEILKRQRRISHLFNCNALLYIW